MLDRLSIRIATGLKDDGGEGLIALWPGCHTRFTLDGMYCCQVRVAGASVVVLRETGVFTCARAVKRWGVVGERGQIEEHKRRQAGYCTFTSELVNSSRQKFA